jgi:hypothetical protein
MSWSFSVALPADPAPCHDAADTIRSVARAADGAADFLDGQAAVPHHDFSGAAADSYRSAAASLGADSRGVAGDTRALAAALDDYAARIAAVRRTLTRVREAAVAQGFEVTADDQVESVPVPGTAVDAAYRRLEATANDAHEEAASAYAAWSRAVQELTTGPLADAGIEPPREMPREVRREVPDRPDQRRHEPVEHPPSRPSTGPTPVEGAPDRAHESEHAVRAHPHFTAASVASRPAWLPLVPDPASHAPLPIAFEGVLA